MKHTKKTSVWLWKGQGRKRGEEGKGAERCFGLFRQTDRSSMHYSEGVKEGRKVGK